MTMKEDEKIPSWTSVPMGRVVPRIEEGLTHGRIGELLGNKINNSDIVKENIKTFESGAQSSSQIVRYDLLPREFLYRVAKRFTEGSVKYSDYNYRTGFNDIAFIIDRINHLQEHLQAFLQPKNREDFEDDNLGAIGWAVAFLIELDSTEAGHKILSELRLLHTVKSF